MEIEAKFLIENPNELENFLNNFANPIKLEIDDIYFDNKQLNLLKNYNCAFRIRKENEKFYFTIKRKIESDNNLFKRIEIEKEITKEMYEKLRRSEFYFYFDDIELKIFPIIEIFSRRKLYLIGNLKVSVDKVFLSDKTIMNFLEIEGDEEEILKFVKELKNKFNLIEWKTSKLETALKFNYKFPSFII
jgi:inorganic triphosphatase YgiF